MKAGTSPLAGRLARALSGAAFVFVAVCCAGGELRIGNGGEPLTLDPHRYNLNLEEKILADLFEGLTAHDAHGRVVPGVARSWDTSEDGLVWTFHLRQDARWSDGAPVTADDFVYSLRRLMDPRTAASLAYFLYAIEGARAVNAGEAPLDTLGVTASDPHTLQIRLAEPFPFLAERLVYPTGYPVPRHAVEPSAGAARKRAEREGHRLAKGETPSRRKGLGDAWVKPGNMVSNGAFTLAEWQPQGFVRLAKNPHFRAAQTVALNTVRYFPSADRNAAYNRYRNGELDIIGDFPPAELDWLRREMPEHVRLAPLLSMMYLVFNVSRPPFDDLRVRRALALTVDRELITSRVLKSDELPSASFVPPIVEGYDSAVAQRPVPPRTADVESARALLAEAGYAAANPLRITLRHIAGVDNKTVQLAIAALWKDIGVRTELHHAELNAHFAALRQGDFQVAQAGWFGENNPEHYLELLMSSSGDVNYGRFADAQTDALMNAAKATADVAERVALLRQAEARALALHPVVPLYSVTVRSLVRPGIEGWHPNPRNAHPARYLRLAEE